MGFLTRVTEQQSVLFIATGSGFERLLRTRQDASIGLVLLLQYSESCIWEILDKSSWKVSFETVDEQVKDVSA